jgi:hypothetical protein
MCVGRLTCSGCDGRIPCGSGHHNGKICPSNFALALSIVILHDKVLRVGSAIAPHQSLVPA